MSVDILKIYIFDGPNRFDPRAGVFASLHADRARDRQIRAALKDAAQRIGLVIGNPEISTRQSAKGVLHELFVVTPMPAIGAAALRYVAAALNAQDTGDEQWDEEEPLWELQKRRRAAALPLHGLQVLAEASARGVPAFVRADGWLQIGYGARGMAIDPAKLIEAGSALREGDVGISSPPFARPADRFAPDWSRVDMLPIIAITGATDLAAIIVDTAAHLSASRAGVAALSQATFADVRACLADPNAEIFVFGLEAADLVRRGVPFDRCAVSALIDLPDPLIDEAGDHDELARALGVALLLTDPAGRVILNVDDPNIAALAEYAPCPQILIALSAANPHLVRHRAMNGEALFFRDGAIIAAHGAAETPIAFTGEFAPMAALAVAAVRLAVDAVLR